MSQLIASTTPLRTFKDHTAFIFGLAVFPDKRRMVTTSEDKTLHLWDLRTGAVLKKMEGHRCGLRGLAVSRDGQMIASADYGGEFIAWHGETGESLTQPIKAHTSNIYGLDFSPDGTVLATGSGDGTTTLWCTKSWQLQGNPIDHHAEVNCVRYSPDGEYLAIATDINIEIYRSGTMEQVTSFKGHTSCNISLLWTLDSTRLLSGGNAKDPSIREWDVSTWKQVGDPWKGHTHNILTIAIHPAGTHIASASTDNRVRLWRLSDRRTIAVFQHSSPTYGVTFSTDGRHILSGGEDLVISEWEAPEGINSEILSVNAAARNACIAGDLSTAEELFTQEINADASNYTSYANRSFLMARKHDWDHALDDALKSVTMQPSLTGYISKGIALCGKGQIQDARTAFDIAFIFTNEDSKMIPFLLLVKVIALFHADQHQEAMQLVQQLAAACPDDNYLAYSVVELYLRVQLGIDALNGSRYDEAADHFTAAIQSCAFSSGSVVHFIYEDLVVLFGLDLEPLWQIANQKRCDALLRAGRLKEAFKSHQYMMEMNYGVTKPSCVDWSIAFKQECRVNCLANGDAALAARNYDRAIELYSMIIDLGFANDAIFAHRSKARSIKMLWEDALLDAQQAIDLKPSSHVGYEVKHAALHGAQHYDEAMRAFNIMLSKLDDAPDPQIRQLRQQYVSPSKAEDAIREAIHDQSENAPLRLLNTSTGRLFDREARINAFMTSSEYKELFSSSMTRAPLQTERIIEAVSKYFSWVMLSHRCEGTDSEPRLHDIQDRGVFEFEADGGIVKLQKFCQVAGEAGHRWAWSDTCCIDQGNDDELQQSVNSMFAWYHYSALTIIYLSDLPPSSKSGAMKKSAWNTRGRTVPECLAPKVIRFYQQDWTLYLNDESPNHKQSAAIMDELKEAMGIDAFQPGMRDVREKLQWASAHVTPRPKDIVYSLFDLFGIDLPIHYDENKECALGRLLQEIVAESGDTTALDWFGQPSTFNSCLPADIISYDAPPYIVPSLSDDEIQSLVSSLRGVVALESASRLYRILDHLNAPRFAHCRLHLPCIVFPVTEAKRRSGTGRDQETSTYGVKADGLNDLQITTTHKLNQFSRTRPARQTFLLVRPWDRRLLEQASFAEQPALADDEESFGSWSDDSDPESPLDDSPPTSPVEEELDDSESHSRALRLMVRLGQPFSAFLLAQQRGGEYTRIASDHVIVAQVKDVASVSSMMDIRTVEIL